MNIELIVEYVGKPIKLNKGEFALDGYIEKIRDNTLVFITVQERGLIEADVVTGIRLRPRMAWEEICPRCNRIYIRKKGDTVFTGCPYDDCKCNCKE